MELTIKYSKHFDLLFHVLAYMKVDNASDLFCAEYIKKMEAAKRLPGYDADIPQNIGLLQDYYNANFERLALINFLPFYSESFDEMKDALADCTHFTSNDLRHFIKPFIEILDAESAFYFEYWGNLHEINLNLRKDVESKLRTEIKKYACVFGRYSKSTTTFLSYSLTRNGRGFSGSESHIVTIVPFPKCADSIMDCFFTLLHEYTHQFTDSLLDANISMDDDTHTISEKIVILADYYLIKAINPGDLPAYFEWIAHNSGDKNSGMDENDFLSAYKIDDNLDSILKKLIENIMANA